MRMKKEKTSDAQRIYSPPTDRYQTPLLKSRSAALPGNSPQFIYWV